MLSEEIQTVTFSPKHPSSFQGKFMDALKGSPAHDCKLECTLFYEYFRYRIRHLQLTEVARFGKVDRRRH